VIILYLLPEAIATIREKLVECLERGCRIICQCWGIPDLQPIITQDIMDGNVTLYMYQQEPKVEEEQHEEAQQEVDNSKVKVGTKSQREGEETTIFAAT
jgi:hypothetical protein